jgi:transposase
MKKSKRAQRGNARVKLPERYQVEMQLMSLDEMVRDDSLVRTVVKYVDSLDLSELYHPIKATSDNVGRDRIDPRILFSLWLFATLEGINSGRKIAQLTGRDVAYMWICGGVSVNYHTICDFRKDHAELVERILTDSIAVLHHQDLVKLETLAQDGMRVRASAGSGSFRRQGKLKESRKLAEQYLHQLKEDSESNDDDDKGGRSARLRAAEEKLERIEQACVEMEDLQERYAKRNKSMSKEHHRSEPRASTTDPEARRMKMGDNGFRPALNVQFSNDVDAMLIVGVDVTNVGSDAGLLAPMYHSVCETYQTVPKKYLADGGFSKKNGVTELEKNGTEFYGKLHAEQKQLDEGKDPFKSRPGENDYFTAFRERMGSEEAQTIYRQRAAAAEFPNAVCRNQGLRQFSVRGIAKAKAQALWHALAYNFRRFGNLIDEKTGQTYREVLMAS